MRACRSASSPTPRSCKPDADGLAPCDIVIDKERIAAIGPAAPRVTACRASISTAASCCRASSTCTPTSTRATSGSARKIPDGTHHGRAQRRDGRPRGQLVARGCAQAHGLRAALRLRARHRRAAHAYRQLSEADRRSRGRVFAEMREQWKGRIALQAVALFPIDLRAQRRAAVPRHGGDGGEARRRARRADVSRRGAGREDRCGARQGVRGRDRATASISISMSTKAIHPMRARSARIADAALRHKFKGRIVAGHCCSLALADDNERAAIIAKVARSRHRGRVAADVQHVSAGPRRRPHAALARCRAAARARCRRRHRDGRERQHARSVLRLWRSRHAGGVSRGDAHPAFRSFGPAVAEDRSRRRRAR